MGEARNESIALSQAHEVVRKMQHADRIVWFDGQEYLNLDDVAHLLARYMTGTHEPVTTKSLVEAHQRIALESRWSPGRWWRVLDAEGGLWCETSDEEEARDALVTCAGGGRLERLWVTEPDQEWRQA